MYFFQEAREGYSIKSLGLANNGVDLNWVDAQFGDGYCIVKSLDSDIGGETEQEILDFLLGADMAVTKQFMPINASLQLRLLSKKDYLNQRVSVTKGWTYTVYVYQENEGDFLIYRPQNLHGELNSAQRIVGFDFKASSDKVYITKKSFFGFSSKQEDSGFYKVDVSGNKDLLDLAENIYYEVEDYKIPLTKAVLEQGYFYIKSSKAPEFKSLLSSISIV